MDIKIQLVNQINKTYGRLVQREPFIIAEGEDVTLDFDTEISLSEAIIAIDDRKFRMHSNRFELPKEYVHAGVLAICVYIVGGGQSLKAWHVEPVILKELDNGLVGHPEIEDIKARLADLEELRAEVEALKQRFDHIEQSVQSIFDALEQ